MQRSLSSLIRPHLARRGFSTSSEKIVASVPFERLPVVIPIIDPVVYAFQEFLSLQRALDRRLYLLLFGNSYGAPSGKPVWHFPEKNYESEETLRKCAESALKSVLGDLSHTYFVGNAPMGHMVIQPTDKVRDVPSYEQFFFKSQVIATNKFQIGKCEDFVWVTKDEVLEYFPEQAQFLHKMIIG
ncbi:hypothetical protein LWI29_032223 [Acer saccharum]|uniref:Large ribosomal subunit protein mL46 n=1 Tax=Acer saccharum TaxID=4024 RepID=A0AA39VYX8_ACESA|nr:hypothetical protein LWI29_032223 [Acer saccharum]